MLHTIPEQGFIRLKQIIGDAKANPPIPPIIPVSRTAWWLGVKSGKFPQPVKIGAKTTAWNAQSIRELIEKINKGEMEGGEV